MDENLEGHFDSRFNVTAFGLFQHCLALDIVRERVYLVRWMGLIFLINRDEGCLETVKYLRSLFGELVNN